MESLYSKNRVKAFWFARNIPVGNKDNGGIDFEKMAEMINLIDPDIELVGSSSGTSSNINDLLDWYNSVKGVLEDDNNG